MNIEKLKKIIENIPEEYNDYELVFSEVEDTDSSIYRRIDETVSGMISDDVNKKLCLMGYNSYHLTLKYNNLNND